jgi:hypothetical protein
VNADSLLHGTLPRGKIQKSSERSKKRDSQSVDAAPVSMHQLKRRWKSSPSERDQILLALRVLFPDQVGQMIAWLNKPR